MNIQVIVATHKPYAMPADDMYLPLHVGAEGKDVIVIVPTAGGSSNFAMGSEVNLTFGGNVVHVFSKETEQNLEW